MGNDRSDNSAAQLDYSYVLGGRRVSHGGKAALGIQGDHRVARTRTAGAIPRELCGLFRDISDSIVLRLRPRNQLLSCSLLDQISDRVSAHGARADRIVRTLPRSVNGARFDSAKA